MLKAILPDTSDKKSYIGLFLLYNNFFSYIYPFQKPKIMKKSIVKRWLPLAVILIAAMALTSCAAGNEDFDAEPAGFLMGLWHGFITLFTFIISLFKDNVNIYEISNSGWPYDLGFILGVMIFYGGSSKGSCR